MDGKGSSVDSDQANAGCGCPQLAPSDFLIGRELVERPDSSNGAASSAFLSRPRKRDGYADGRDGPLPDRNRALGRHAVLEIAQPTRADGAQVTEAAVRD